MGSKMFIRLSALSLALGLAACNSNPTSPAPEQPTGSAPAAEQKTLPGPVAGTRLDAGYVSQMGRSIYF